ncbi:unnamed protein product, partial [marine sediment metagenome]
CYKTEDKIDWNAKTSHKFVKMVLDRGHESVIEHESISVKIICDRGVTHEIVRHRLVAYSQESTRYCNYKSGVTFVIPPWCLDIGEGEYNRHDLRNEHLSTTTIFWVKHMLNCEEVYIYLLSSGWSPQQARSVLPNSLKTEIVMTANIREWRHILKLRTSKATHPQMREIMIPLLKEFQECIGVVFDDIYESEEIVEI